MKIKNRNNHYPNILHFHGNNIKELPKTFDLIYSNIILKNKNIEDLTIYSTWTNEEECCLYKQCLKNNIAIKNIVPDNYDKHQKWYMPNKITFFLNVLKECKTKYVLFLDGYDVLITHLEDIIDKFLSFNYRIIFNASCNNYPDEYIETIKNRQNMGVYRYFNAGCCIGYKEDLIKFYEECLEFINEENPLKSEQLVLRHALKKYMFDENQKFIHIDYDSLIFQSMGKVLIECKNNILNIGVNLEAINKTYLIIGTANQIGKDAVLKLKETPYSIIYQVKDFDLNEIIEIIENEKIDNALFVIPKIKENEVTNFIDLMKICEKNKTNLTCINNIQNVF